MDKQIDTKDTKDTKDNNKKNSIEVTIENTDSIVFSIVDQFVERSKIGKEKYGTTLDRTDLSILDWIQHAKEEHMDAILYLEKLKQTYLDSK